MTSDSIRKDSARREFIEVCGWESFQYSGSHRKANPPWKWFRIHNSFLESPVWFSMTKPQRADFITLLSLASRTGNMIPNDKKWLRLHGASTKTLPSLEQLSLIREFSLPIDDKRIMALRSVFSGGTPPRGEERREEENRGDAQVRSPGAKDSDIPIPDVPNRHPLAGIDLGQSSRKTGRMDRRPFDELKLAVKSHIERFGADPDLIHRFAGQSLKMTPKQIATCVDQLVSDGEVTLPVRPEALQ